MAPPLQINYTDSLFDFTSGGQTTTVASAGIVTPNVTPTTITDGGSSTGDSGYLLSSTGSGLSWIPNSGSGTPSLATVLSIAVAGDADQQPISNLSRLQVQSVDLASGVDLTFSSAQTDVIVTSAQVGASTVIVGTAQNSATVPTLFGNSLLTSNVEAGIEAATVNLSWLDNTNVLAPVGASLVAGLGTKYGLTTPAIWAFDNASAELPVTIGDGVILAGSDESSVTLSSVAGALSLSTTVDTTLATKAFSQYYLPVSLSVSGTPTTFYLPLFSPI